MQLAVDADRSTWWIVEPGTAPEAMLAEMDAASAEHDAPAEWRAEVERHVAFACRVAERLRTSAWVLADDRSPLAAAFVVLAFDGPATLGATAAVEVAARLVDGIEVEPLVGPAILGGLAGHVVTFYVAGSEPFGTDGASRRVLQSVVVAADGAGNLLVAVASPQPSQVAGAALIAMGGALRHATLDA